MSKKFSSVRGLALSSSKGFTLIEILVVIGIIAILAAVVLLAINPARQFAQARDSQRTSNVTAILNAVGQFMADNKGTLPAGIGVAKAEVGAALCAALVPTYLPALPTDPSSTKKGASIDSAGCAALVANDVKYDVIKDANGRVTVSADGEVPPGTDNITITR